MGDHHEMNEDRLIGELAGKLIDAAGHGGGLDEFIAVGKAYVTGSLSPAMIRNAEELAIRTLSDAR